MSYDNFEKFELAGDKKDINLLTDLLEKNIYRGDLFIQKRPHKGLKDRLAVKILIQGNFLNPVLMELREFIKQSVNDGHFMNLK